MAKDQGNMMRYAGLATQWMVMMGLGTWAGFKLDKYLNWGVPLFIILFPLVSLVVSLYQIIKEFSKKK